MVRPDGYDLAPVIAGMKTEGLSLRRIASRLNQEGHTTRRGEGMECRPGAKGAVNFDVLSQDRGT
jgi:hypothetical protein